MPWRSNRPLSTGRCAPHGVQRATPFLTTIDRNAEHPERTDRLDRTVSPAPTTTHADPLAAFSEPTRTWFAETFAEPTPRPGAGLGRDQRRPPRADPRADGQRQDPGGVPVVPRPAHGGAGHRRGATVRVLYVSPLKALAYDVERNLRSPLAGIRRTAERIGVAVPEISVGSRTGDTPADARRAARPEPARHPRHHARVALPAAHQPGARDPARRRARHRRRGPRHGRHEARRAPRAEPRAPEPPGRCRPAAHRPVGDAAAAVGDRARSSAGWAARSRSWTPARERSSTSRSSCRSRTWPAWARRWTSTRRPEAGRRRNVTRSGQSIHPRLLELIRAHRSTLVFVNSPAARRAAGRAAERARRRGARAGASRQRRPRAAARDRGGAQGRAPAGAGRDEQPRAGDRHGRDRPRRPGRGAAVGRVGDAAHRSGRAHRSASPASARSSRSTAATWSRRRWSSSA